MFTSKNIIKGMIPVVATPCTKYFCKEKNRMKQGTRDKIDMVNMESPRGNPEASKKSRRLIGTVYLYGELR
jgi:hypothetical protein